MDHLCRNSSPGCDWTWRMAGRGRPGLLWVPQWLLLEGGGWVCRRKEVLLCLGSHSAVGTGTQRHTGEGSDADGVPRKGFLEWGEVRPGLRDPVSESCSPLTGAETEVQRGHVACLGTHGQREEALGLDPGYLCSQVNSLPTPRATSPSWEQAGSRGFPPDRQGH